MIEYTCEVIVDINIQYTGTHARVLLVLYAGGMGAFLSLERMPVGGRVCRDY